MKKLILTTATAAIMLLAASCGETAPKSNEEQPQTSTTETAVVDGETATEVVDNESPKVLAKQEFDLIMQLEGTDDKDPVVIEQLEKLQKKVEKLSEVDQKIYKAELYYLYTGEEYVEYIE